MKKFYAVLDDQSVLIEARDRYQAEARFRVPKHPHYDLSEVAVLLQGSTEEKRNALFTACSPLGPIEDTSWYLWELDPEWGSLDH